MNKVALVTGGARGIGLGIADALAREGFDLVITGRRPIEDCVAALEGLRRHSTRIEYLQSDVSSPDARRSLVDYVQKNVKRLDVLINNAGIAPPTRADILEASEQSFDQVIGANLKGPYFLTQAVAQWMIQQKEADPTYIGCIVHISSISATVASVNRGEYCISKAGVAMATKLWAVRLAEFGINVYEVRPGIVATGMTEAVREKYDAVIDTGLLERRWGKPEDIGKAVAMLIRGDLPYATGSVLVVDGGLTLQRL
ncbi:MAG TPA: 3-ketoacyl-ACP reductase [Dongiaceae bacterium]|nr:3-ketoacyl-ACP reductase [Dongiaceae bacterium]